MAKQNWWFHINVYISISCLDFFRECKRRINAEWCIHFSLFCKHISYLLFPSLFVSNLLLGVAGECAQSCLIHAFTSLLIFSQQSQNHAFLNCYFVTAFFFFAFFPTSMNICVGKFYIMKQCVCKHDLTCMFVRTETFIITDRYSTYISTSSQIHPRSCI